ncbi:MAG: hypothetical protein A2Y77_00310 [Planctomycetes bacterium RBG_13_62_9]|nr:MAG: hypothetical protein A2Y77_00310 [Planctomycetes bacterium RBG_13_62_9]
MADSRWGRIDVVMRSTHLYTGLFLAPWFLVYATSGFCLNHNKWLIERLKISPAKWELVREVPFTPDETFPRTAPERAIAILERVGLPGAHNIVGNPNAPQMVIMRPSGTGAYRVTWRRAGSLLVVERMQPFSVFRLLHFLHFRFGYTQPYFAHVAWAAIVDVVTISMWVWVLSGFYIWLRRPRTRLIGSLFALGGSLLFIVLTILLCR